MAVGEAIGLTIDLAVDVGLGVTGSLTRSLALRRTIGGRRHDFALRIAIAGTGCATGRGAFRVGTARVASTAAVRDAFGSDFQYVYTRLKDTERTNFERIVTSLDYQWYAHVA